MTTPQRRKRIGGEIIPIERGTRSAESLSNTEAEAAVLGAVMRDQDVYARVSETLQPGDFYLLWHGYVWYAIEQVAARGAHIDVISVADEMEALKQLGGDGVRRLSIIADSAPSAYSVETYANIVRDAAIRLRMVRSAAQMTDAVFDREKFREIDGLIDECNRLIFEATDQNLKTADTRLSTVINSYFEQAEIAMSDGVKRGIRSGFANLDDLLRGAVPGELSVLAGAEGMGKTTFMLGLARNMAKAGIHVAIFTLEMSQEEIARILISMESGLPKRALKAFDFTADQWAKFVDGSGKFQEWGVHIIDEFPSLTPIQLRRRLRTMTIAQHEPVDVVIIDGLWLMEDTTPTTERHEAVRNITRDLIQIARDFNVPIYITHQYNGDAYHRNEKRPMLHDLAESAGVRRNAQVIMGLYRDSYYGKSGYGSKDVTELHILKDRNGSGAQGFHADFSFDATKNLFIPTDEGTATMKQFMLESLQDEQTVLLRLMEAARRVNLPQGAVLAWALERTVGALLDLRAGRITVREAIIAYQEATNAELEAQLALTVHDYGAQP